MPTVQTWLKKVIYFAGSFQITVRVSKPAELSPNLLSEMSLPEIEVPIGKLLPKISGRLGNENLSK